MRKDKIKQPPPPGASMAGDFIRLPIDQVRPYWRNPRRVPDEAVNAIASSITEYGYVQPIVVDDEHVIIIGHTRYAAMRRLGQTEIDVLVTTTLTPSQVKELRVIDNRVAEYTSWDFEKLMGELLGQDSALLLALFPEASFDVETGAPPDLSGLDERSPDWDKVINEVEFICPGCYHQFEINVTRDAVFSGVLRVPADEEPTDATA